MADSLLLEGGGDLLLEGGGSLLLSEIVATVGKIPTKGYGAGAIKYVVLRGFSPAGTPTATQGKIPTKGYTAGAIKYVTLRGFSPAGSGGDQILTPTGPAVFTWVAPTTSLRIPQVLVPTGPAVFTWVAPDASLDRGGQQLHPTGPAVFTWVAPTTTIVGTGSATLVPESVTFFRWRVPNRTLRGGASRPGRNLWHGLPFNKYTAVTPSDTVNLPEMCLALYVGAGGDVVAVEQDGQVRTFVDVPTGSIIAIAAVRVNSTGTSAASIVALNRV